MEPIEFLKSALAFSMASGLFGLVVGAVGSYAITGYERSLVRNREGWGLYAALVSIHALTVCWVFFLAGFAGRSIYLLFTAV